MITTQLRIITLFIITLSLASCGSDDSNSPEINCDSITETHSACDITPKEQDSDNDGIFDHLDNCINNANPDQLDTDADDTGDICDTTPYGPDSDDDAVPDLHDNCPNSKNTNQQDKDSDNIGDLCDNSPLGDDIEPPVATILFPPEFSISKVGAITVRGTATDETWIDTIKVNGIAAVTTNNYATWSINLELEQGLNEITVETSDSFNTNQESDRIEIQMSGPSITYPRGLAVDKQNNKIFWTDTFDQLLSASLLNSERHNINIPNRETLLTKPRGVILSASAEIAYIADTDLDHIIKMDLITEQSEILSNCPLITTFVDEMALDQEGNRLIVSGGSERVVAVDLTTGDCTILFSAGSSIGGLAWNSGNQKIYYGKETSLYAYNEATETTELITAAMQSPLNGHVKHLLFDTERNSIIWHGSNDYYDTDVIYMLENGSDQVSIITNNEPDNRETKILIARDMALSPDEQEIVMMEVLSQKLIGINIETGIHRVLMDRFNTEKDQGTDIDTPAAIDSDGGFAYTIDRDRNTIVKVNLNTGVKEVFLDMESDFSDLTKRIEDIRTDKINHQLYIMTDVDVIPEEDYFNDFLPEFLKVDLTTKVQSTISSARSIGDEPDLHYADDFELDIPRNRILVIDTSPDEIVEIDISTGERNIFSGDGIPNNIQEFSQIKYSVMDIQNDRLLITDSAIPSLMAVNLETGGRTIFSESPEAQGILAIDNFNQRLFSLKDNTVYQLDLQNKTVTTISDWSDSDSPNKLADPDEMTYNEQTKLLYVTDDTSNVIFVIDSETGARVILSN